MRNFAQNAHNLKIFVTENSVLKLDPQKYEFVEKNRNSLITNELFTNYIKSLIKHLFNFYII